MLFWHGTSYIIFSAFWNLFFSSLLYVSFENVNVIMWMDHAFAAMMCPFVKRCLTPLMLVLRLGGTNVELSEWRQEDHKMAVYGEHMRGWSSIPVEYIDLFSTSIIKNFLQHRSKGRMARMVGLIMYLYIWGIVHFDLWHCRTKPHDFIF